MGASEPARPLTPYERFVEATKLVLSVSKKEVNKAMKEYRRKLKRKRERS